MRMLHVALTNQLNISEIDRDFSILRYIEFVRMPTQNE